MKWLTVAIAAFIISSPPFPPLTLAALEPPSVPPYSEGSGAMGATQTVEDEVPVFSDISVKDHELVAAAAWAVGKGILVGYRDGTLRPDAPLLKRHVALVAKRSGRYYPPWIKDYGLAARGQVRDAIPGLDWREERWDEPLTRSQLLRLVWRSAEKTDPDDTMAARLDAWFMDKTVTWHGVTRTPRLSGYGGLIVAEAHAHQVPIWLALAQCWRESQWGTTGLAIDRNMLWGVKDRSGKWGEVRSVTSSGFADYITLDECIKAYFRLMDNVYRSYIDLEDWRGLLNKYAPAIENDVQNHYVIVMTVRQWCEERGIQ